MNKQTKKKKNKEKEESLLLEGCSAEPTGLDFALVGLPDLLFGPPGPQAEVACVSQHCWCLADGCGVS